MPALLAPVPAIHLQDGMTVFQENGAVAFGSDYVDLFEDLDPGLLVYVYASASGFDAKAPASWIHKVSHSAVLSDVARNDGEGCPWPELRGSRAAAEDSKFGYYWKLVELEELRPPRLVSTFRSLKTKKLVEKLERAILVADRE